MTALKGYDRLEAMGLWRADAEAQRREVVVSLGEATLTISDTSGRALAHWSLAAVTRTNRGKLPALFHPDGDPDETLEIAADEKNMIDGIESITRRIERARPHPGKLRFFLTGAVLAAGIAAVTLWLPDALVQHTVKVVPPVKRAEIGLQLLERVTRVTGQPCAAPSAAPALQRMALRVLGPGRDQDLVVLRSGVPGSAHLPGGIILLDRATVEDHEDADATAGFVLAEHLRAEAADPLHDLLRHAGLIPSLRLLTTGALPPEALEGYAETLLRQAPAAIPSERMLAAFAQAELRSTPYAYAIDVTGETTLALIEADPRAQQGSKEVLSDADWVRLQGICDG
ncbi:MAG: hypothetical protein QNJ09_04715 [Paracoccaceae bacterium]|nr:hypothetical protein [Paracoccaceae bacterium]